MDTVDGVLRETRERMAKTLKFLQDEFSGVRTGKASPALLENVRVQYYGAATRLREIANIAVAESRLLVVHAYDPTSLPEIEKAILAANLGLTPANDGRVIRVPIPELSEERRREMTKVVRRMAEENRVAIRNERRDANEAIRKLQKEGGVSEDQRDRGLEAIQKLTDDFIVKIDEVLKAKEEEVLAV